MEELISRGLHTDAEANLAVFPVLKIQGARQVGKSTLSKMLIEGRDSIYKTLDREVFREQAEEDADLFVESPQNTTVVIDEIQRVPKVTLAVKHSVDEERIPGRFILTGSSDFTRAAGAKDSLAGRSVSVKVYPLSFAERQGTLEQGTFVDRVLQGKVQPDLAPTHQCSQKEMMNLVATGGYPAVQHLTDKQRATWFAAYIADVVGIDVLDQKLTTQPSRLKAVLRSLAVQQSGELIKATLARENSIPETSISSYVDILETVYLVELIRPWSRNLLKREKGKPKILINDSGLAAFLSGQSPATWTDIENPQSNFGHILEGALIQELLTQRGWSDNPYEVLHWRDREGHEVDIVCELADGSIIAIEVKAGKPRAKHFDTLKLFRDKLGNKFRGGFVVSDTNKVSEWSAGLYSIPWSSLWN